MHVFELQSNPQATRAYGWFIEGSDRLFTKLHSSVISGVLAAVVSGHRHSKDRQRLRVKQEYYCGTYWHPDQPRPQFHELDERDGWWRSERSAKQGVYALFDSVGQLLYIGKASYNESMGGRLWHHMNKRPLLGGETAYVQFVEVAETHQAPSLEEFLILELQPRYNFVGRRDP